jgi:hypothetical protein
METPTATPIVPIACRRDSCVSTIRSITSPAAHNRSPQAHPP